MSYPPQGGGGGGTQGPPGPKGDKGEHGDPGEQGTQGAPGTAGQQGTQGEQGIQGSPGTAGAKGDKGDDGTQGIQGLKGDTGNTGAPGQDGAAGQPGQQGTPGTDGTDGSQGIQGIPGADGEDGAPGGQGIQGIQGVQGNPGAKGDAGDQGIQGNPGVKGDTGNQGIQGIQGNPGEKGDKGDTGSPGPVYTPPSLIQKSLAEPYPFGGASTTLTPTTHTATVARVFPFEVDRPITVNAVYVRTNAVLSNCLILGIYNESGTRLWQSGVLSTVLTGWVPVTANLPITLPVGLYYLASTNNNVASTTAAYTVTPALGTATLPRWGTVPATAGAIPASITPASITKTVGGWMNYILLSNVTT